MSGADVCFDNSHHASNGCAHPLFYAVPREIILRINRVLQEPHYNKILKDQLAELDREIQYVEAQFRAHYGLSPFVDLSPSTILRDLVRDIVTMQQTNRDIEHDLEMFEDIKMIKMWLKAIQRQSRSRAFDEPYF